MKWLRGLHTGYGMIVFIVLFLLFLPVLIIPIVFPKKFYLTGIVNRWWARALFAAVFIPVKVEYRFKPAKTKQYIFCPNHFSYLDIPTLGLNYHNTIFVGKSDIEKIPLFGFMYKKLHITVNRSSLKSRVNSLKESMHAIDKGKSLVIYPEGGIVAEKEPVMGRFKDGAFRIAIEKQIPLVPVTIPYNWIILPAHEFVLHWHPLKIIFHEPVDPAGYTLNEIGLFKEKVYRTIHQELINHLEKENYEYRPRYVG